MNKIKKIIFSILCMFMLLPSLSTQTGDKPTSEGLKSVVKNYQKGKVSKILNKKTVLLAALVAVLGCIVGIACIPEEEQINPLEGLVDWFKHMEAMEALHKLEQQNNNP